MFLGLLIGYGTAPLVVKQGSDLATYLLYQALAASVAALLVSLFFRGTPPVPPSRSAGSPKLSLLPAFLSAIKNRNFLIIFFVFSVAGGGASAFATVLDEILHPW